MNRLTVRTLYGICGNNERVTHYPLYKVAMEDPLDHGITRQCLEKLAEYEDLEEQGLLLRLPCKVGDKFWELNSNWHVPCIYPRTAHTLRHVIYCMERLGEVTFLTYEEAEAALEKMKGE